MRLKTCLQLKTLFLSSCAQALTPLPTSAPQALLIDLLTGSILLEKNAHQPVAPSSMTKILTAYLVFEALKNHSLNLNDQLVVSPHAAKQEGSRMFLIPNQRAFIEDVLKGIIVVSGNDACTALAEHMAGGREEDFAEMMNEKARELGLRNSHFSNASGLPHPEHTSTCFDLAEIAKKTFENFPDEYKKYYSIQKFSFNKVNQTNRNVLLKDRFADGMKTGKTDAGKCGMVASSERQGRRLLLVINGVATEAQRAQEARRLIDWGFSFFEPLVFFSKGQKVADVPVWGGEPLPLIAPSLIAASIPKRFVRQTEVVVQYRSPSFSPIEKGQPLGALILKVPKQEPIKFLLVAGESRKKEGFFQNLFSFFQNLFSK